MSDLSTLVDLGISQIVYISRHPTNALSVTFKVRNPLQLINALFLAESLEAKNILFTIHYVEPHRKTPEIGGFILPRKPLTRIIPKHYFGIGYESSADDMLAVTAQPLSKALRSLNFPRPCPTPLNEHRERHTTRERGPQSRRGSACLTRPGCRSETSWPVNQTASASPASRLPTAPPTSVTST